MSKNTQEQKSREVAESARQKDWRKPSFMKDLFLGDLHMERITPFPGAGESLRPEYLDFRERFRAYLLAEIDPLEVDATGEFPEDIIERLTELGALGMNIPAAYGGLGLSKYEYCRTMQLFSAYEGSLLGFLSPHQSVGVPECVKLFGTDEQKKIYLPRCAQGEISAFALTENEVGSDPANLATTLENDPAGEGYLLNGVKLWCTNGTVADLLVVMARHKETGKISAFIVETAWPGVKVTHRCRFMGLSALQNGVIEFENVRVPKACILGKEGAGLRIALTALNTGRLSIPFGALGVAKKALEVSRTWAAARQQWGRRLGDHEAIALKVANMAATVFAMESCITLACRMADAGELDIRLESAASKEFNTTRMWNMLDDTMQIRGGRGYEKESSMLARGETPMPAERLMRDQRVARIFEGASEIMHLLMAREAVDKHLEVAGAWVDPEAPLGKKIAALPKMIAFYARWYPTRWLPGRGLYGYGEFGPLASHMRFVHRASRKLARQAFHGMLVHQAALEYRQGFLFRWVDIALELFAMSAATSHAHTLRQKNAPHAEDAIRLADLFCRGAKHRVNTLFRDLWKNDDRAQYALAQETLDGRYAWLEEGIISLQEAAAGRESRAAKTASVDIPEPEPAAWQ